MRLSNALLALAALTLTLAAGFWMTAAFDAHDRAERLRACVLACFCLIKVCFCLIMASRQDDPK